MLREKRFREPREKHDAVCAECGKKCQVPFKPDPTRPVYCRECWRKRREAREKSDRWSP